MILMQPKASGAGYMVIGVGKVVTLQGKTGGFLPHDVVHVVRGVFVEVQ